jgi:hypothetical protein
MQIVIDIPEEYYDLLKGFDDEKCSLDMLLLKHGTPLPKGHGALKDADKLAIAIAMIRDRWNCYGNEYESAMYQAYDNCVDEIIDAPTIIDADEEGAEE